METLDELVTLFVQSISDMSDIYNEISLQHELGYFLRRMLPTHKVQFERNVTHYFPGAPSFVKSEIDISAVAVEGNVLAWAIELKYPRNGQYPEQMFNFCKDIRFAEQLKAAGFARTGLIIFADDPLFYQGPSNGIYGYFRNGQPLCGRIQKPTGAKDLEILLAGNYAVRWRTIRGSLKYAAIQVNGDGTQFAA